MYRKVLAFWCASQFAFGETPSDYVFNNRAFSDAPAAGKRMLMIKPCGKEKTHFLADLVRQGEDVSLLEHLKALEDTTTPLSTWINDPSTFVQGYRQPYSMLHLAMDPAFHKGSASIESRLNIVRHLVRSGSRVDLTPVGLLGYFANPLLAGAASGNILREETRPYLQATLLLLGADPLQPCGPFGNNGLETFIESRWQEVYKIAREMHDSHSFDYKEKTNPHTLWRMGLGEEPKAIQPQQRYSRS